MTLDDFLRYLGLLLQVLGLATTAVGIADVRRRFTDRPGVFASARARLRLARGAVVTETRRLVALLSRRTETQVPHVRSVSDNVGLSDSLRVTLTHGELPADMPVEQQLAELDRRTRLAQTRLNALEVSLEQERGTRAGADRAEATERARADDELRGLVRELAGGGLRLQT